MCQVGGWGWALAWEARQGGLVHARTAHATHLYAASWSRPTPLMSVAGGEIVGGACIYVCLVEGAAPRTCMYGRRLQICLRRHTH